MSGHSKWSTIKHKKEATDAAKGKLFSKLTRAILIAIKTGGGPNPETNYQLKIAIDQAKVANMPKANIERALKRAEEKAGELEETVYEGFGPGGIAVVVEVATDNRNRTGQEIKNLFERGGGSLGGPGSVSFNFKPQGLVLVAKDKNVEDLMLRLMDIEGVEDVEETEDSIEVYTSVANLKEVREKIEGAGIRVVTSELVQKPLNLVEISDTSAAKRALSFLDAINDHDDVQKVYANLDIPDEVIQKVLSSN